MNQQDIIQMAREAGIDFDNANMALIGPSHLQSFFSLAYQRGVRDEREALKSICEELEQHYSDYAATALLNGDIDLSVAASGEPRACRAMIDVIRARGEKGGEEC